MKTKNMQTKKKFGKKDKTKIAKKLIKLKTKLQNEEEVPEIDLGDISNNDEKDEDDDLMNFDLEESEEESVDSTNDYDNESIHIPSMLQVASEDEEEDSEDEDEEIKSEVHGGKLTLKTIKEWQKELTSSNPTLKIIRNVMLALNAAVTSISDNEAKQSIYKIENPAVFNATIQLCILYLHPSISKYLETNQKFSKEVKKNSSKNMQKGEKWRKLRNYMKHYFTNLATLIECTSNSYMSTLFLKHLHQMSSFTSSYTVVSKAILKALINLWSSSQEDSVRVLSFLCILKITRSQQKALLNHVLKAMYISYIRNCKFVSPNTLAGINFMRRSLIEIFLLDTKLAYQHAFLYIRQLAIHLRNAIILKKKENFQAIHNWQYVNSIKFWAEMLSFSEEQPDLKPLVYPLVNLTIGLMKCTPTVQYYPLRFHCIQSLITLSKRTNVFIPILPFIFEILKGNLFKKSSTGESFKPLDFTIILRVSKTQINDNNFKKEVIEQICAHSLEYLEQNSASLAYPDLVVPTVILLKKFIKNCKDANANRKLKQLLDKIQDNSRFIENERRCINFALNETSKIQAWETTIKNKGTPLSIYYKNWYKTNLSKKKRQAANTSEINDINIPVIKRKKVGDETVGLKLNNSDDDSDDFFAKDSEDENIVNEEEDVEEKEDNIMLSKKKNKEKSEKLNKSKKKVTKTKNKSLKENVNINDEVENLNIENW